MKELTIGPITLKSRYVMAPLAGYTNCSMRTMVANYGAALSYTEMISSSGLVFKNQKTLDMLPKGNEKIPVALQLFGGDKEIIKKSIEIAEKYGKYDFLDFNMGCPVPKVLKQFSGSFWLKREDELQELFHILVSSSHKPVLIKTRIGFDDDHKNILNVVKMAAAEGIAAVAIHGRTRAQLYGGNVDYEMIRAAVDLHLIPIIANGDINLTNFREIEDKTQAAGYMIGRQALGHPQIFENFNRLEEGLEILPDDLKSQASKLLEHFNLLKSEFSPFAAVRMMRGIGPFYFKGLQDSSKIRTSLVKIENEDSFLHLVNKIMAL